jgi:PAS domain S-box-containing protein
MPTREPRPPDHHPGIRNILTTPRWRAAHYSVFLLVVTIALLFIWPGLVANLFATGADSMMFMPHGHCYLWIPQLVWLHVGSDVLIGSSYVAISLTLAYLVHRARRDIPFHWVFLAFGMFIIACGATHFMEVWTLWTATYWLSGYVKLITAVASVATALVLPPLVPKTLALVQSAKLSEERRSNLQKANEELGALRERERLRAEEELEGKENLLRLAVAAADIGTWDFNPVTGALKWDARCKELFGLPPESEVNYDVFLAGLHPEDRERTDSVVRQTLDPTSGGEYDIEYRTVGIKDGVERWVAARGRVLFDSSGQAVRFAGTILDTTERKRVEAERERIIARERQARQQAEEANRIKDEFLATLSHELRTPMTSILGWTQLIRGGQLEQEAFPKALDTIYRNTRAQTQLIDDLLDVSRVMTGKLRLDVRSVELSSVIVAATDAVRPAAEGKGIRLQTLLDPKASPVSGDPDRLQQVVWNLVSNAVKFTPKGGRVQVRLERINSHVEITVSDTGSGISPEFLPHVFDRFRQADQSHTRVHGGLGLGLAIVRQLIELHGGTVRAHSLGEGQGAAFTVSLPLLPIRAETAREGEERVHPAAETGAALECPPQLEGLHVVVDDEPDTRDLLVAVLTGCGARVRAAGSSAEALLLIEEEKPDVLVSDIGMPGENGYELIAKVRRLLAQRGGKVPAVALTAYARMEDRVRALSAGYQVHIPKPVEPVELITAVASLAGRLGRGLGPISQP